MIRIGIVDDEENARRVISKYLERYCENYEIVFQSEEYQESIDAVLKHKPDLLFLDIHILNGSGIDVASNPSPGYQLYWFPIFRALNFNGLVGVVICVGYRVPSIFW